MLFIQVGNLSDMPTPPENFPKCGNYIPPVANPPIRMYEKPKSIIPLTNGSNPHHPQYKVHGNVKPSKSPKPGAGSGRILGKNSGHSVAPMPTIYNIIFTFTTAILSSWLSLSQFVTWGITR